MRRTLRVYRSKSNNTENLYWQYYFIQLLRADTIARGCLLRGFRSFSNVQIELAFPLRAWLSFNSAKRAPATVSQVYAYLHTMQFPQGILLCRLGYYTMIGVSVYRSPITLRLGLLAQSCRETVHLLCVSVRFVTPNAPDTTRRILTLSYRYGEITYYVSGGKLNSTHSLDTLLLWKFVAARFGCRLVVNTGNGLLRMQYFTDK